MRKGESARDRLENAGSLGRLCLSMAARNGLEVWETSHTPGGPFFRVIDERSGKLVCMVGGDVSALYTALAAVEGGLMLALSRIRPVEGER